MKNIISKIPDTFSILLFIMGLFILLTWIIPAGVYDRESTTIGGITKEILVPGSYREVDSNPQGIGAFLMAPIKGFIGASQIIGFCLIVGGAFGVFNRTGAINAGLSRVLIKSRKNPRNKKLIVPAIMILFSLAGATFGMSESVLVFIMITVPLALALGYDSIVGISMSFLAAGIGFAGAFFNPFTIGIAQGISEIPVFSGWEYRILIWVVLTSAAILFVLRYIRKIEKHPEASPVFEIDNKRPKDIITNDDQFMLSAKHKTVLWLLLAVFVVLVIGSNNWGWYINEISALFTGAAILVAIFYRLPGKQTMEAFTEGAKGMTTAALVIGISRGLLIIATDGKIIDTLLHSMAEATSGFSPTLTAQLMFLVQGAINFFVPSGSGQAALTMPVMAPLSDLVGVSRQTAVLAFQLGDGIFNMIIPTSGVTIGALSISKIPYQLWFKWLLPFTIMLIILSALLMIPPTMMFYY
ncbi:MAG: TIGR00366 family protein [Bacteroidales bacterium]|nr:TIGR00366 family protein [Bacteroidales bacterium]